MTERGRLSDIRLRLASIGPREEAATTPRHGSAALEPLPETNRVRGSVTSVGDNGTAPVSASWSRSRAEVHDGDDDAMEFR